MCIGNLRSGTESLSQYFRTKEKGSLYKALHFFGIIFIFAIGAGIGGVRPVKAVLGPDLLCIFDSEEQIRSMKPDQSKLAGLPGRGQDVTGQRKGFGLRFQKFFPEAPCGGGSGMRLSALPDSGLLVKGAGQARDPRIPGVKERRAFILRDAGEWKDSHKRRSNPRGCIRDSSGNLTFRIMYEGVLWNASFDN